MKTYLDDSSSVALNRIRILKTGLYDCNRYLDMNDPENRAYFRKMATPGTELLLVRDHTDEDNPWKINVLTPDGRYIGRVTPSKSETAARLMDAGFEVIAIVNDSLRHNSDTVYGLVIEDTDEIGWTTESREQLNYELCNLPFGIYLVDE